MNRVSGRIVLRETNLGIPHLRVTAYDTNSSTPSSSRKPRPPHGNGEASWDRLGSNVTGVGGAFDLTYEDHRSTGDNNTRPNLALLISTAEESGKLGQNEAAPVATITRRNAASDENFLITLDKRQLTAAGIPIPRDPSDADHLIEQRRIAAKRQQKLRAESNRLFVERLKERREFAKRAEPAFEKFLSAVSAIPEERRNLRDTRYVPRGTSVVDANKAVMQSGIRERINRATAVGAIALSDDEVSRFKDPMGKYLTAVSPTALEPLLRPRQVGRTPGLQRRMPPALLCRDLPLDPCVEILEGKRPADDDHHEQPPAMPTDETPTPNPTKAEDIPLLIGNLVNHMTPPESTTIFKVQSRAGVQDIQQRVNGFALESGPADVPALHDFHHLQIAFEHVWHELFDESMVANAKELYTTLVELGADPNEYQVDLADPKELKEYLKSLKKEAAVPDPSEPDMSVIQEFDITPEQWNALEKYQGDLRDIIENETDVKKPPGIKKIKSDKAKAIATLDSYSNKVTADIVQAQEQGLRIQFENEIREAHQRGENMIRYADYKLNTPERFRDLHQVLSSLEKSMSEPYQFSIYAANRFGRSVNFGLVATYRQEWVPKSYQVGELVKTVPLAPKEVRKFTKKVTVRKSRAEKEVENNLQSRRTDSSETSRIETEIIEKAQKKTNFQTHAEAGINIGIADAKGSTAFNQDAAAESQAVKKEFREAVFKATEEYKSERNTEINVSTGEETSFEESGEISNPNDEIPVTYLFYELQRRYQVSEKIHQLTPVVLVAQEFPTPNEIDDDWIIANDWILRRVILDDSFIPAMNYLSSKVVGDEFSLEEMYKNLRQQRRIADELKEEQVAIREQAGRRYAALEESIQHRVDAIDGNGVTPMPVGFLLGGPSAEQMQAREDAAKDAYERAAKEAKELQGRLERELTALNSLTETYTKNLSDHLNRKAQIARLRVHIKSNIMFYMQAIWSHEHADQRYFRLHQVKFPNFQGKLTYTLQDDPDAAPQLPNLTKPQKILANCDIDPDDIGSQTLEEVADLDNLLGFKGNYMMFPLKKSNVLTDFMMIPYLDPVFGLRDPDALGNWILTDFV
jgi:hypothetical protein